MPRNRPVDTRIKKGASLERAGPLPLSARAALLPLRVGAAAVDFIVLALIGFGLTTLIGVPTVGSSLVVVLLMLVVSAIYFVGSWTSARGSTPGMLLFGLAVRDVSGAPIAREAAVRRWLALGAPFALGFFYGWGAGLWLSIVLAGYYGYLLFTVAQSADGRGVHDEIGDTVVVSTRAS